MEGAGGGSAVLSKLRFLEYSSSCSGVLRVRAAGSFLTLIGLGSVWMAVALAANACQGSPASLMRSRMLRRLNACELSRVSSSSQVSGVEIGAPLLPRTL